MTKELYNELLNKKLITDPKMTLDYINKYKIELKDIITIPAVLADILNEYNTELESEEIVVDDASTVETEVETEVEIVVDDEE